MEKAIGSIFIFSIAGLIFGDNEGRKIAIRMLVVSLTVAFMVSPAFAIALVLAPLAMCLIILGMLISFVRKF